MLILLPFWNILQTEIILAMCFEISLLWLNLISSSKSLQSQWPSSKQNKTKCISGRNALQLNSSFALEAAISVVHNEETTFDLLRLVLKLKERNLLKEIKERRMYSCVALATRRRLGSFSDIWQNDCCGFQSGSAKSEGLGKWNY